MTAIWVWLGLGYTAYYFCRTTLPVVRPYLLQELVAGGMSPDDARRALGAVVSWSLLAAAIGKFAAGILIDRGGGRKTFVLGGLGVAASTFVFTLGGSLGWILAWSAHRLSQTLGWPSMMRRVARSVPRERTGWVVGWLSMSWLAGDAASRAIHGLVLSRGGDWRLDMRLAAGVLAATMVCVALADRRSANEDASDPARHEPAPGVGALLGPLLGRPAFWCAALSSVAFTAMREGVLEWGPTWLVEHGGMAKAAAAAGSAWFPLGGAFAALLAGRLGDRAGGDARSLVLLGGSVAGALGAAALLAVPAGSGATGAVLLALVGFAVTGPYALLLGAVAIDLGGGRAGATASSLIDGCGSLAAVVVGSGVAEIVARHGWRGAVVALASAAFVALVGAVGYRRTSVRTGGRR